VLKPTPPFYVKAAEALVGRRDHPREDMAQNIQGGRPASNKFQPGSDDGRSPTKLARDAGPAEILALIRRTRGAGIDKTPTHVTARFNMGIGILRSSLAKFSTSKAGALDALKAAGEGGTPSGSGWVTAGGRPKSSRSRRARALYAKGDLL